MIISDTCGRGPRKFRLGRPLPLETRNGLVDLFISHRVIPAKAGTPVQTEVPAFAGMTPRKGGPPGRWYVRIPINSLHIDGFSVEDSAHV